MIPEPIRRLLPLILLALSACAVTERGTIKNEAMGCRFIGVSCSQMKPGKDEQAALRYLAKDADWTRYKKVLIDPITFWGSEGSDASGEDQQMLIDYLHQQVVAAVSKRYEIVTRPGPDVLRVDIALSDASAATPVLRSVSVLYPQAHLLSNVAYAINGQFPFGGGIEGASRLTDSITGKLLGGFIDHQVGGGAISTGFQWKWGDAQNAIDLWVPRSTEVVYSWTSGQVKPTL